LDSTSRNPALLIAPGTRARLELARGVAADVLRGSAPGPTLWIWAVRGAEDPSLQQALGELSAALEPGALRGSVGLLLDGPAPPIGRETYPLSPVVRALSQDAGGILLLCGAPIGHRTAAHAAADLDAPRDRRLARELGLAYLTRGVTLPVLNRTILTAPVAWLVAGESDRLERTVIDTTREALQTLLVSHGFVRGERELVRASLLRTLSVVELLAPGLVELVFEPGALVRRGATLAHVGVPGAGERQPLRAPCSGVVLQTRAGHLMEGPVAILGRLPSASKPAPAPSALDELGWCELVDLPDLGITSLPAKVDTGARTSALHVHGKRLIGRGERGRAIYEIEVPGGESAARGARTVKARVEVIEQAVVRDSGGHAERRLVIETRLIIGNRARRVRLSLTDRGDMRFPMLVGRTALDARTRIDPTRAFLARPTRRRQPR